jgi:hypothetical protein
MRDAIVKSRVDEHSIATVQKMKTAGTSIPAVVVQIPSCEHHRPIYGSPDVAPPLTMTMSVGCADELLRRGSERLAFLHHVDGG